MRNRRDIQTDPFEGGLANALLTHLHLLASVSFAAAVHVEAVGVARRSRFDAANRVLAAIAASRGRASDVALGALLDAAQTRVEALRSSLTEAAGPRPALRSFP